MTNKVFLWLIISTIFVLCHGSIGEAWSASRKGASWGNIWQAKKDAEFAKSSAGSKYAQSLHNGIGDAFRHCLWNCLMTVHFGASQARIIADNHEDYAKGPCKETEMDLHNNAQGRRYGSRSSVSNGAQCIVACDTGTSNGDLQTSLSSKPCTHTGGSASDYTSKYSVHGIVGNERIVDDFDDILISSSVIYMYIISVIFIIMIAAFFCGAIGGIFIAFVTMKNNNQKECIVLPSNGLSQNIQV